MMPIRAFLQQQNIQFSLKRYAIDAINFMALGLFSSLIIGLILKNIGTWMDIPWLIEAMGNSSHIWLTIGLLHFILPACLTLIIAHLFRSKGWIKLGDLKLNN